MSSIYVARQKIVNVHGRVYGYELLFRDAKSGITNFPKNIKATAQVLLNVLTYMDFDKVIGQGQVALLNVDHSVIESGVLEVLDPERFVIEILETTELSAKLMIKLERLKKLGFQLVLDDFDCSNEMIAKFKPIMKFISMIKIDLPSVSMPNLLQLMPKYKQAKIKLLAEKVEDKDQFKEYTAMGFDLFQGYHIDKPEVFEVKPTQEATQAIILQLIALIKRDDHTMHLEKFIKQRPEISYNIIKFLNNQKKIDKEISSIVQVITLMGRNALLRWLLIYLYAEVADNEYSSQILKKALSRAEEMERLAHFKDKEQAYLVGLFSMLDLLFEAELEDIIGGIKLDPVITKAVIYRQGPLGKCLQDAQSRERDHLEKIFMDNFHRFEVSDLLAMLLRHNIKF